MKLYYTIYVLSKMCYDPMVQVQTTNGWLSKRGMIDCNNPSCLGSECYGDRTVRTNGKRYKTSNTFRDSSSLFLFCIYSDIRISSSILKKLKNSKIDYRDKFVENGYNLGIYNNDTKSEHIEGDLDYYYEIMYILKPKDPYFKDVADSVEEEQNEASETK